MILKDSKKLLLNEAQLTNIKNKNKLGRIERKKLVTKIRKNIGGKLFRIKKGITFNKSESLTKNQRRELMKDKDLIKELIKIIKKYFPMLMPLISNLTDKRHKSYITYNMRTIIMTKLFALICGITTMNGINNKFNTEETISNLSKICEQELNEVPDWQTVQDVIETLEINEIENIRKYIVKALIRSKMFDKYKYRGYFQILVDATGLSSHDYNLNGNCIIKKSKNNVIKYYKQVLEAKIVVGNIVISIDTEWIENADMKTEKRKQDCEINAFKRMAPRLKNNYPKMKFIITGDALYANTSMIDICNKYKWKYIFNLKKDRLKQVYNEFEDELQIENETNQKGYSLICNIKFNDNIFHCVRYQEYQKNKLVIFNYITNLKVNDYNIKDIVETGRSRWKIENEGFNEQKNGTFCITHLCSRNENALRIHYYLIQIAHIIRQLLDYGSILLRSMMIRTKKEVSALLTNTLTLQNLSSLNDLKLNFQLRFDS